MLDVLAYAARHPGTTLWLVLIGTVLIVGAYLAAKREVKRDPVLQAVVLVVVFVVKATFRLGVLLAVLVVAGLAAARHARRGLARRAARAWIKADGDWDAIAAAHGLEGGRVVHASPTGAGRRLTIVMPRGVTADKLRADTVASAAKARAATIAHGKRPGMVVVTLRDGADPLEQIVPPTPLSDDVDLDRLTIGRDENGAPWRIALRGTHLLVAGVTGSGKGSVLWSLLRAAAPAIHQGTVQAWALDPKGGMELGIGRDLFSRFADDYDDMLALLDDAVDLMRARARRLAGVTRTHTPTSAEPLVVVVIDEVANLTAYHPTATYRRDALSRIALLATQGRAVGVVLVCALQDPRKEVLSIRSLFPAKVGLRLDEAEQVRMVLGESARDRGAICDRIAPTVPGVGYVVEDGKVDPRRVRASHVDDAEVRRVARTYAPPRTSAPTERSSVERAPTRTRHPNLAEASPVDAGDADTSTIDRASRPTTRRRKRSARPTGDAA